MHKKLKKLEIQVEKVHIPIYIVTFEQWNRWCISEVLCGFVKSVLEMKCKATVTVCSQVLLLVKVTEIPRMCAEPDLK